MCSYILVTALIVAQSLWGNQIMTQSTWVLAWENKKKATWMEYNAIRDKESVVRILKTQNVLFHFWFSCASTWIDCIIIWLTQILLIKSKTGKQVTSYILFTIKINWTRALHILIHEFKSIITWPIEVLHILFKKVHLKGATHYATRTHRITVHTV